MSAFVVTTNQRCIREKRFVLGWVLGEVFGFEVRVAESDSVDGIELTMAGEVAKLRIPTPFFDAADDHWLASSSLPKPGCKTVLMTCSGKLRHAAATVPVVFAESHLGSAHDPAKSGEHYADLNVDVFGTVFFLISRYEEAVVGERDEHARFPSSASHLGKCNLLARPLVNEYIEVLWDHVQFLWPQLQRKTREFRVLPSHDIDHPSLFASLGRSRIAKQIAGDLLKRRNINQSVSKCRDWVKFLLGDLAADPYDQIEWIMECSERCGTSSAFYYIPEKTDERDSGIPLNAPVVEQQWKRIHERGHEIGVHPGYQTFASQRAIRSAADGVREQLEKLGMQQECLGGRQHFLRWRTPDTARYWNDAGLDYDSTLGFADQPGFRCGVCYEFPIYDLAQRRPLTVRERPLIAMDVSVMADHYLGFGQSPEAFDCLVGLKNECRKYQGDFTLLWHNTELLTAEKRELYQSILQA